MLDAGIHGQVTQIVEDVDEDEEVPDQELLRAARHKAKRARSRAFCLRGY